MASPKVMVYFRTGYAPGSIEEAEEYVRVLNFKDQLQAEGVLTKDYEGPNDFRFTALGDILYETLPAVTGVGVAPLNAVWAVPSPCRAEGTTESAGDVFVRITVAEEEFLTISLVAIATLTSRVVEETLTDIRLMTQDRTHVYSRGKLLSPATVQFEPVPLKPGSSTLLITGIRFNATHWGGPLG